MVHTQLLPAGIKSAENYSNTNMNVSVSTGTTSSVSDLSQVLAAGNSVGTYDIDVNGQQLQDVDTITNVSTITANSGGLFLQTNGGTNVLRITSTGVGIGTSIPLTQALLDVQSTTQGLKVPIMSTVQKNAIADTAGLVVFDTTLGKLCIATGFGWQTITSV